MYLHIHIYIHACVTTWWLFVLDTDTSENKRVRMYTCPLYVHMFRYTDVPIYSNIRALVQFFGCTCTCTDVQTYIYIHMYIYVRVTIWWLFVLEFDTFGCTCTCTDVQTYIYIQMFMCVRVTIWWLFVLDSDTSTNQRVQIYTFSKLINKSERSPDFAPACQTNVE